MTTLPQKSGGSSSSDMKSPSARLESSSSVEVKIEPDWESWTNSYQEACDSQNQVNPTQKPESSLIEAKLEPDVETWTDSYQKVNTSRNQVHPTQELLSQSEQEPVYLDQDGTPSWQNTSNLQQLFKPSQGQLYNGWGAPTPQQHYAPQSSSYYHSRHGTRHRRGIPILQQFRGPEKRTLISRQFHPYQRGQAQFNMSTVDPTLLNSTNSPHLHGVASSGRPSGIPAREFHRWTPSHDEPTELALSDIMSDSGPAQVALSPDSEPAELALSSDSESADLNEDREATKHRYNFRRPKVYRKTKESEFTSKETRFLILMRAYWGASYPEIARAASREFNRDRAWTTSQIAKRLGSVKRELEFKGYWKSLERARSRMSQPKGLSTKDLKEAKGFIERFEKF